MVFALALSCLPFTNIHSYAAKTVNLKIVSDVTAVSSSYMRDNSKIIHCRVYVEGTDGEKYIAAGGKIYSSDDSAMYFGNIINPANDNTTKTEYKLKDGTIFDAQQTPFCFGTLSSGKKRYTYNSNGSIASNNVATAGVLGSTLYSDGKSGFWFKYPNYKDKKTGKVSTKIFATDPSLFKDEDVEEIKSVYNQDNEIKFEYAYYDQKSDDNRLHIASNEIKYYRNSRVYGDAITGNSDTFKWKSKKPAEILGSYDEMPFLEFDAILKKGTKSGTYTITLDSASTYVNSTDTEYNSNNGNLTQTTATITVTDGNVTYGTPQITYTDKYSQNGNLLYYAGTDNLNLTASTFIRKVTLPVTYNGTTKNMDITKSVTIDLVNPKDIYDEEYDTVDFDMYYDGTKLDELHAKVYNLGDTNKSGATDSSDATQILIDYANVLLSGGSSSLERNLADVNNDGVIDSSDATAILIYYANVLLNGSASWN